MAKNTSCGVQLRIRGKVQGVGFRPFVWQLAQQLNLHGDVCNDGDGVEVRLLEDPGKTISEIALMLGYFNRKYFTSCFKAEFGMTPSDYQKRLNEGRKSEQTEGANE